MTIGLHAVIGLPLSIAVAARLVLLGWDYFPGVWMAMLYYWCFYTMVAMMILSLLTRGGNTKQIQASGDTTLMWWMVGLILHFVGGPVVVVFLASIGFI